MFLLAAASLPLAFAAGMVDYTPASDSKPEKAPISVSLVSRTYVPYDFEDYATTVADPNADEGPETQSRSCTGTPETPPSHGNGDCSWITPTAGSGPTLCPKGCTYVPKVVQPRNPKFDFGMGAAEQIAYDPQEKYLYAVSEQGVVTVVDYADPKLPRLKLAQSIIELQGESLTDIDICPSLGLIVIGQSAKTSNANGFTTNLYSTGSGGCDVYDGPCNWNGKVHAFETVKRNAAVTTPDGSKAQPAHRWSVEVGVVPDMLMFNSDCTKIAVANEGEGVVSGKNDNDDNPPDAPTGTKHNKGVLFNPPGSVSILYNLNGQCTGYATDDTYTCDLLEATDASATCPAGCDQANGGAVPDVQTVSLATVGGVARDDQYFIDQGVHMPLTLNAMKFWDVASSEASDINWEDAIGSGTHLPDSNFPAYSADQQLEPEYLAWSSDDNTVYVNMQENNALVKIDVSSGTASAWNAASVHSYGLKDWSANGDTNGIDITKGDTPAYQPLKPAGYKTLRMPDGIAAFKASGVEYIVTANEGDDKEYGKYEEKTKLSDCLDDGDPTVAPQYKKLCAANFALANDADLKQNIKTNFGDDSTNTEFNKIALTMGSSGVDYETSSGASAVMTATVGFGGRGITIYKVSDMSVAWDSKSEFEKYQSEQQPFAHNSVFDEEFARKYGPLWNQYDGTGEANKVYGAIKDFNKLGKDATYDSGNGLVGSPPLKELVDDRSLKDGAAPEAVAVGQACGRLIAVTSTEKSGTAFFYDITDPTAGRFLFTHHLTPISEHLNPPDAYSQGQLGDVDAESVVFLEAGDAPDGKVGVIFGGAWSGTVSYYQFTCGSESKKDEDDGPDMQIIIGSALGGLVVLIMLAYWCKKGNNRAPDDDDGMLPPAPPMGKGSRRV